MPSGSAGHGDRRDVRDRAGGHRRLDQLAAYLGLLGAGFSGTDPPELVTGVRTLAARYAAAAL
jgi:hypothetical protein